MTDHMGQSARQTEPRSCPTAALVRLRGSGAGRIAHAKLRGAVIIRACWSLEATPLVLAAPQPQTWKVEWSFAACELYVCCVTRDSRARRV